MCLFSNSSQMVSKCGKNKKVVHKSIAKCVTDVVTVCHSSVFFQFFQFSFWISTALLRTFFVHIHVDLIRVKDLKFVLYLVGTFLNCTREGLRATYSQLSL